MSKYNKGDRFTGLTISDNNFTGEIMEVKPLSEGVQRYNVRWTYEVDTDDIREFIYHEQWLVEFINTYDMTLTPIKKIELDEELFTI